jgi:hypothetical protein
MRRLILFFLLIPFIGFTQHYIAGGGSAPATPYVYDGGWSVPAAWVDSLGAIDITDGRALAASTIKILVDTRAGNRTFAFTVTAANGYTVKWGKKETAATYANNALAERTYDTTKCQKYCVIEITKTGAGAITAFTVSRSVTFVATQSQYPAYLWIAANYTGVCPLMYISTVFCLNLQAIWLSSITQINGIRGLALLRSLTIPSTCTTIKSFGLYQTGLTSLTIPSSVTTLEDYSTSYNNNLVEILGMTGLTSIGINCFLSYSLRSIILPSALTSIKSSLFGGNVSLKTVKYTGTVTTAEDHGTDMFYQCEQIDTLNFSGVKTTRFAFYGQTGKVNKLGSNGNLAGDSIPIRLNWASSTFSNATAPQLNLSYNSIDSTKMQKIFRCLPTVGAAGSNTKRITITGNPNPQVSAGSTAIATGKGWQVVN